ncbi:MAG: hypothetical protein ACRERD_01570, partial [Candidatus Binatia bacterium]
RRMDNHQEETVLLTKRAAMIAIDLPPSLERHFQDIVREGYDGNLQVAIATFLKLHERYGWKERLREDVRAVRTEVRRRGEIKAEVIDRTVKKYRQGIG